MSLWDDMDFVIAEHAMLADAHGNDNVNTNVDNEPGGGGNAGHAGAAGGEDGTIKRSLACSACRERKVRCNKEQPVCGRCAYRGLACTYPGPSKQTITKLDLGRLVLNLQERLHYAETQGVFRAPRRATSPPANDARTSWPEMANSGMLQSVSPAMERSGLEYWQSVPPPTPQMDLTGSTLAAIHARPNVMGSMLSSGPSSIATTTAIDWRVPSTPPQATGFLPLHRSPLDPSNTSDDFGGSLESAELSSVSPPVRHVAYFEFFDPIMPIINRKKFQASLAQSPDALQVQALSQALAMLGALGAPELGYSAEAFYAQARTLLEMCERQDDSSGGLATIAALQTCVLLAFYELKQANFARAWLTLGRGIRLGKILGFMGQVGTASNRHSAQEAEEGRRTTWQLYILDAFAIMRTEWDPVFEEMTIPLPSPGPLADVTETTVMPNIAGALASNETHALSTFASMACVITMYRRCFNHIFASQQDESYPFWDNYYKIDKLVSKCRACFLTQHAEPVSFSSTTPLSFVLFMNVSAVEISLHKAAINRAELDERHYLAVEAEARCLSASAAIADAVRSCRGLGRRDYDVLGHASTLFAWAITIATQAHLWMLVHGRGSRAEHMANLSVLRTVLREHIGAEHVRPGLLDQIEAALVVDRAHESVEPGGKGLAKRPGGPDGSERLTFQERSGSIGRPWRGTPLS